MQNKASKVITRFIRAKTSLVHTLKAIAVYRSNFIRKLSDYEDKWAKEGIQERIYVNDRGEEVIDETVVYSDIKKKYWDARAWMNNIPKEEDFRFTGPFKDVITDSGLKKYFGDSQKTFKDFVEGSPRVLESVQLMRTSGKSFTICFDFIHKESWKLWYWNRRILCNSKSFQHVRQPCYLLPKTWLVF